jgi:hypothetical protein
MILPTDNREKRQFIVKVSLYSWAIANLLPPDKRDEAISNLPKDVYFKIKSTNKYSAFSSVADYCTPKTLSRNALCWGCLYIPWVIKQYPLYHINDVVDVIQDDCLVLDLNNPSTLKIKKENKWHGLPKEKRIPRIKVVVETDLPEFYKDKLISVYNLKEKISKKIRYTEYYYEDSPYTLDNNWKKGYAPKEEEIKPPPIPLPKTTVKEQKAKRSKRTVWYSQQFVTYRTGLPQYDEFQVAGHYHIRTLRSTIYHLNKISILCQPNKD